MAAKLEILNSVPAEPISRPIYCSIFHQPEIRGVGAPRNDSATTSQATIILAQKCFGSTIDMKNAIYELFKTVFYSMKALYCLTLV